MTPPLFFLEHWGPEGLPTAEGCSGAGAVAPPSLRIWRSSGAAQLEVATDGFFMLEAYGVLDPTPLVSTATVRVTMLDGAAVPGKLSVVKGKAQGYLAWQADAPLGVGTKLNVAVEGPTSPGAPFVPDQAELVVAGEPAPLAAGTLSFETWRDYRHGVGAQVTCLRTVPSCGGQPIVISVFAEEEKFPAVYAAWHAPADLHGFTLWEVDIVANAPAPDVPAPATAVVIDPSDTPGLNVVFAAAAAAHCLTIQVKDLRTGAKVSAEQCTAPGAPPAGSTVFRDFPLEQCDAPPSAALTPAWCEARSSTSPVCQPSQPVPDEPSRPTPNQPSPAEPESPPPSNAADGASGTSQGCQVALVGASAAGGALTGFGGMVGLLSLLRGRWRRSRGSD
ncbi:MAG: hypothetical protein K0R38_2764 [Polyangiaceae bacterium]|jgi:hypothetical protein|nr:hypothetical protein [Polyangiaceae bacterium]